MAYINSQYTDDHTLIAGFVLGFYFICSSDSSFKYLCKTIDVISSEVSIALLILFNYNLNTIINLQYPSSVGGNNSIASFL